MNDNKIYLIFNEDRILIKLSSEKVLFPNEDDVQFLNLSLKNIDTLAVKDNIEFMYGRVYETNELPDSYKLLHIRSLIGSLDAETFNLAAKAFHLMNWNETHNYCIKCGTLVNFKRDEQAKICPSCSHISYPAISPAIITAIIRDNKILLAHNSQFPKNLFSVIAGFLEPGETFEACVKREVYEEIGIQVKNIKYFSSQPWPFPNSLMVAFTCEYESGEISVDGAEIEEANWYSPSSIQNVPSIPVKGTIARRLIDWFLESHK
ncbi:NADH pyrophosphatase [Clostridium homopropionicum DSM 5847]|uniref:NAD(+) diphosphatase n=1 Tax=Clostridium homopropionicum DSM 5847 TaxID=1121318 RepID=A0A0L6Z729_9CLOT|nr:NAD(+) diphosphatase [Clostridium homopropionicum]KOA18633.1 NADH pyrophosphatase [Clostridium homopropionicum DSM 5847]SFG50759.1 NAD+ diphosphatase [Clostridium homopropionicum]